MIGSTKNIISNVGIEGAVRIAPLLARVAPLRHTIINLGKIYIQYSRSSFEEISPYPPGVQIDRAEFSKAIFQTADRVLTDGLSANVLRRIGQNLGQGIMVEGGTRSIIDQFHKEYGSYPPGFLTLSPGKVCNLRCVGCYANADSTGEKLDWTTFERIIAEAKTLWGVRFMVISGGEPFAYRSEGKGILEAAEKHPEIFFLVYTNGTLIDDKTAKRLAELGNITPAISLEGWRARTDERRGEGVFDQITAAMDRLHRFGVPFGVSLTATRHNVEEILSDEFIEFLFEEKRALYGWIFHYMPIGRSFTLDLMPTPEQRVWMWQRTWEIIRQRNLFLADFWNHGTLSDGCVSGGRARGGGYFYIDWNGAITPCVFVPYSPLNIKDVYAKGGTLNDIWSTPFFSSIRDWQENYRNTKDNWLAPCINRDHHAQLQRLMIQYEPDPIDESASKALQDADYGRGLENYGKQYQKLADPIWKKNYLTDGNRQNYDSMQ